MDQFGSLPDSGQLGYQKYIESIDDCATLCNAEQYCCAFEYSDSKKRCYMNVDCNPTRPPYKSYNYCMKEAGMLVFANQRFFKVLNLLQLDFTVEICSPSREKSYY